MQLNLRKLDERIQKLQEIRRISADPELVTMLFEFMAAEDERTEPLRTEPLRTEPLRTEPVPPPKADAVVAARVDDSDIVSQVIKGIDAQGNGLLRKRV